MKGAAVAAAATLLAGGVSAHRGHGHAAAHKLFERKAYNESTCVPGCTTVYSTIKGTPELYIPTAPPTIAAVPTTTPPPAVVVPTPIPQTCPTPGTYTFPATTVTLTETTTVCGAATTEVPSGTYTLGGVTTVVETETTVVCPYATTKTENGVVTSVLETTTYVCPSAGTYTIAPITTTVTEVHATVVYPVVTTYCPGTYTAPAVTTVVETATVIYCPFETPAPAPAPVDVPAPQAYEVAAPPPPPPAQEYHAPPPAAAAAVVPKPKKHSPPAYSGGGDLGGKGEKWAMTYTPFRDDGHCKTKEEVYNDIAAIARANFDTLRVYSTDCDTLPHVGAAAEAHGLKMIVGIFIGAPGCSNGNPDVATQIGALKAWKRWDLVSLCVVGNEALFNGFCTPGQLKDLIYHVKSELGSAGYKGPYTTTDVVSAYEQYDVSEICAAIDVVACNSHAYFNGGTLPHQAGEFVKSQLSIVEKICGKKGYVMETGWPTKGQCFGGVTCPGYHEQKVAINSIKDVLGKQAVFFSFDNDPWKGPGDCGCEQSWGCRQVFGV
ncbi:glycoside hydrolase [Rhypophila sp. PSN 637]